MNYLGKYYRTYALDFWGFGESGKKRNTYEVQDFVKLVDQFMEQLGISQAPLVGHSMGGTVSLSVAYQYPQRTNKVVVIGSPIHGSSLALPLKLAGYRSIAWMLFNSMGLFRLGMRLYSPFICKDERFPNMMDQDLSRTTLESFLVSIATLKKTDLRPRLKEITQPVMGMYGEKDNIVHPNQWKPLLEGVPNARIERFENAGHFIMIDQPQICLEKIKDFLDN